MTGCHHAVEHAHYLPVDAVNASNASNAANASNATGYTLYLHSHIHLHNETFCQLPSWDDFQVHLGLYAGSFVFLVGASMMLSACRSAWSGELVARNLRKIVRDLSSSKVYLIMQSAISLLICALHVMRVESEDPYGNIRSLWNTAEKYSCLLYLAEVLTFWLYATANSSGGISGVPVTRLAVDCAVLPSVLFRWFSDSQMSHFSFSYVASLRIYGLWCAFRSTLSIYRQGVTLQLVHAGIALASFVFCMAMFVQQAETLTGPTWPIPTAPAFADVMQAQRWDLASSLYFVLVTITTVGYGDLWPRSVLGQLLTVGITTCGVFLALRTAHGVLDAARLGMGGGGVYERKTRNKHVVVSGTPSYQVLCDFVQELYHEDHVSEAEDLNLVLLLNPAMKSTVHAMKAYFSKVENRHLKHRVWILQGSALKRRDLDRVAYKDASMAWLLPNLYATDSEREDAENAMRALAMRRHTPYVRIAALMLKLEHKPLMLSVGVPKGDILCASEVKQGLLGKACQVQGFTAWAAILLKNTSLPEFFPYDPNRPWLGEYVKGLTNELYEVSLSKAYLGAPFGAIALDVLERSDGAAFLIGVVEEALFPGDETVTKLFPGRSVYVGTREDRHCKGIFISGCREDIVQHPPWKNFSWTIEGAAPLSEEAGAAAGAAGGQPNVQHPNAVPEPLASSGKQGYVREPRDIEADKLKATEETMAAAASLRAAQGVRTFAKVSQREAERLVGGIPGGRAGMLIPEVGADGADVPAGAGAGDVAKALLSQHQEAQREAEREAEVVEVEAEIAANARNMAIFQRAVRFVEEEEEEKWKGRMQLPEDQEIDDDLWGGPPPPPLQLHGAPREPPGALLVRGGHVLILALDTGRLRKETGSAGSPTARASRDTESTMRAPGSKHGLAQLLRSLRAGIPRHRGRSVVVLADEVPRDWPDAAAEGDAYLVQGPPLSGSVLRRGGLQQAHLVIVHQLTACVTDDPSTVDAEAVFAVKLIESLITAAGKDIPVICDLMLDRNAFFTPHLQREEKNGKIIVAGSDIPEQKEGQDDEQNQPERKMHVEDIQLPFYLQTRFANGQLFVSGVITAAAVNMMYNPALASIFQEMISSGYVVIPVPEDWKGDTYTELFTFIMRRKNLLAVGLLRKLNDSTKKEDPDEAVDDPTLPPTANSKPGDGQHSASALAAAVAAAFKDEPALVQRWSPIDCPSERCVIVMPPGDMEVLEHDGIMCMLPSTGKAVLPPLVQLQAPPGR